MLLVHSQYGVWMEASVLLLLCRELWRCLWGSRCSGVLVLTPPGAEAVQLAGRNESPQALRGGCRSWDLRRCLHS